MFQFTLSCTKGDKTNEASAIYMITELDLPQLAVDLPPAILTEKTNVNQEVLINLTYPCWMADGFSNP